MSSRRSSIFPILLLGSILTFGTSPTLAAVATTTNTPANNTTAHNTKTSATKTTVQMYWTAVEPILIDGEIQRPLQNYLADVSFKSHAIAQAKQQNSLAPLRPVLQELYQEIESRKPRDVRFHRNAHGTWIGQAQTGWVVNKAETETALLAALKSGEARTPLTIKYAAPQRSIRWAKDNKLKYLGSGVSSFKGSPNFRVANIRTGSTRVDNIWLQAGQEFNFNKLIGPITTQAGFAKGYVIKGKDLVSEEGGGICQVSTTVFRAAFYAGMPITERHEHSYQVGYYGEPGLDASVYAPLKNLRWTNDTTGPMLVQVDWSEQDGVLMVSLFGQQDGRQIHVSKAKKSNVTPAPPPRYIADPKLRAGQTHRIASSAPGAKVFIQRTVIYPTGEKKIMPLKSNYVPWAGSIAVPKGDARLR